MSNRAEWLKSEQTYLWDDLDKAIRHAVNGAWSIECESTVGRLAGLLRFTGPLDPGDVPWRMLAGGVYEAVLGLVELDMPPVDWDTYDRLMVAHGGIRAVLLPQYAATVAEIRNAEHHGAFV